MASVLNQLPNSRLSLDGNGIPAVSTPFSTNTPSWGFAHAPTLYPIPDPHDSQLHYEFARRRLVIDAEPGYSVDGTPKTEHIVDFNMQANGGLTRLPFPSKLDELDPDAPNFSYIGRTSVISQIYKSSFGKTYRDIGPSDGVYW
jgi:hypothetical protein